MAEHGGKLPEPVQLQVSTICDLFLDHSQQHNSPRTYAWYKGYLQDFCDQFGALCVLDLRSFHVHRWLDQHKGWGLGSRRCGIVSVKRAFHFAYTEGILRESPLRALK